jgi:glucose-1-phosphatase
MAMTGTAVVFDLGGVLAKICHTWEEAARAAGLVRSSGAKTSLYALEAFAAHQGGELPHDEYVGELAVFLGCSREEAERTHNSILLEEYPGAAQLVEELKRAGYLTGCLSNTNEAHWEELSITGRFPTIRDLDMKMASHLVGINKPDPRVFELFTSRFGLEESRVYYFDDDSRNVAAACGAGWIGARIDPEGDTVAQMRRWLYAWRLLPPTDAAP